MKPDLGINRNHRYTSFVVGLTEKGEAWLRSAPVRLDGEVGGYSVASRLEEALIEAAESDGLRVAIRTPEHGDIDYDV